MINGEGPTSINQFDSKAAGGSGDVSPGSLSRYSSSGGGESEFERYFSANSVMGTPSLGSSFGPCVINNDSLDSDFGSLKSLDNFSLAGGRFNFDSNFEREHKLSDRFISKFDENRDFGEGNFGESSRFDRELRSRQQESVEHDVSELGLDFDGSLSRCNHSDDDDDESMYGCGSDDDNRRNFCSRRNLKYSEEDNVGNENENPLLINSSVAFGSDDWDDFEQEALGAGTLATLPLDEFREQKQQNSEAQRQILSSDSVECTEVPVVDNVSMEIGGRRQGESNELVASSNTSCSISSENSQVKQSEEVRDIPVAICLLRGTDQSADEGSSVSTSSCYLPSSYRLDQEVVRGISVTCNMIQGANETTNHSTNRTDGDLSGMELSSFVEKETTESESNILDCLCVKSEEIVHVNDSKFYGNEETGIIEAKLDMLSDATNQICSPLPKYFEDKNAGFVEDSRSKSSQLLFENGSKTLESFPAPGDLSQDHPAPVKVEKVERNDIFDDIVNEMEEILLDSSESPGAKFPLGNHRPQMQQSLPSRDGGPTASTSGADDAFPQISQQLRIDGIEVVGAKQKKGDVSFSERLVGVKEYTVYKIRVWSGKDQWEVERRYRDFFALYRQLNSIFTDQGWTLPLPWLSVEKESRKLFGNVSPDVVSERSILIQECLSSIILSEYFSKPPSALFWFLYPHDSVPISPVSQKPVSWSVFSNREPEPGNISNFGKTISLIVEIRPYKATKQLLEAQHYTCAGCHKRFDDGKTLVREFVKALGWGNSRFCEYTGQLFCTSCHTNETAVLPARVLHYWDFTPYPVSQLAKSYLDSIYEQPMLCVSAVNPFLFSKVPALHHITNVRKKIGSMLPYVRCPFRRTINKGLGSRRYLLESNDFFALKDLIDLSKGAFAGLPTLVETVSQKILEHIVDQCLVCCDVGVPCGARQACDNPSSLIFPFQESEIERCKSCGSVFHVRCFRKLTNCYCGAVIRKDKTIGASNSQSREGSNSLVTSSSAALSIGTISGLFSRAKYQKVKDHKDTDTVILMGSLPSTTL